MMKEAVKSYLRKVPGLVFLFREAKGLARRLQGTEAIFRRIYGDNAWVGQESVSGPGSDHARTETIRREIPILLGELGVSSMLDIPCGDFHWMKLVELNDIDYVGADIIPELIADIKEEFEEGRRRFVRLDLMRSELPRADLILVRDCLVHLSFDDVRMALRNICQGDPSTYLLTTTHPEEPRNKNILTGDWRPLNLERAPFNFPEPIRIIKEGNPVDDRSLGLWRLLDIPESSYSS